MEASTQSTTDIDIKANKELASTLRLTFGAVDSEIMERICLATEEQVHRMEQHIRTGAYMMQMVLGYEGDLVHKFLRSVLNGIRSKNQILRTRLVKHEGQVYQVVLKDVIVFDYLKIDIQAFLAQNSRRTMSYGTPLLRYAIIQAPHDQSFLVWSVHCCAVDNWTLRLLFDELQTACWALEDYLKLPPRPPYARYTGSLEVGGLETGRTFWLSHHTAFDSLRNEFPVLGPRDTVSQATMRRKHIVYPPKVENTQFDLLTLGRTYLLRRLLRMLCRLRLNDPFEEEGLRYYRSKSRTSDADFDICIDAAWALTIACLQNGGNLSPENEAISFISMTSTRRSNIQGIKDMMGPISARAPLRIQLTPDASLEELMRSIENEFTSMIGFEHCAMKALHPNGGLHNLPPQAVFSWNPLGSDFFSERIACVDRSVTPRATAILAYREDLSVAYTHDYGLLFEVYERDGYLAIFTSWDHVLVSEAFVGRLVGGFGRFLSLIVRSGGLSLRDVMMVDRAEEMERAEQMELVEELNRAEAKSRAEEVDRARERHRAGEVIRAEEMD